jgi:hypothetical protein
MSRSRPPVSPEVEALLDRERVVPPLPSHVRARAVERAQAALIAGRVSSPFELNAASPTRWRVAIALACAASVAAAATAYEIGSHRRPAAASSPKASGAAVTSLAAPISPLLMPSSTPAPAVVADAAQTPSSTATTTSPSRAFRNEAGPEELRLLGLARAAVARHDFTGALVPIGEHTRRFKDGRLTEEREALRVKALAGLGRTKEARRAANAFESRFPRSVLLPAVSHMGNGQ